MHYWAKDFITQLASLGILNGNVYDSKVHPPIIELLGGKKERGRIEVNIHIVIYYY